MDVDGSNTNRVSWVAGFAEDALVAEYYCIVSGSAGAATTGVGINGTNIGGRAGRAALVGVGTLMVGTVEALLPGWNYAQAVEASDGTNVATFYGDSGIIQSGGLQYRGRY